MTHVPEKPAKKRINRIVVTGDSINAELTTDIFSDAVMKCGIPVSFGNDGSFPLEVELLDEIGHAQSGFLEHLQTDFAAFGQPFRRQLQPELVHPVRGDADGLAAVGKLVGNFLGFETLDDVLWQDVA